VDDIKKDRQGGNGTVIFDLGDEPFADTGLSCQLFQGDILLCPLGLDLVAEKQQEFFVHNGCDRLLRGEDTENTQRPFFHGRKGKRSVPVNNAIT
jgi:hypothetical protein